MTDFFRDIGHASRHLARTRWFTATAVLTLALGIGGQTLFFAAVNAMVFRPIRTTHLDGFYALVVSSYRRVVAFLPWVRSVQDGFSCLRAFVPSCMAEGQC